MQRQFQIFVLLTTNLGLGLDVLDPRQTFFMNLFGQLRKVSGMMQPNENSLLLGNVRLFNKLDKVLDVTTGSSHEISKRFNKSPYIET